jgi:hypothetical protein
MSLGGIITPMNFDLVKAALATLLATERDNQLTLLANAGTPQDEIDNDYYFNVVKDLFRLPDVEELPCVTIYNASGDFGTGMGKNYRGSKWHTYQVAIDCYSVSTAEDDARSDKLCAERLDYLWSQVFKSLMSEENFYVGLSSIIRNKEFRNWEQKTVRVGDETAETILAIQSTLELQFEEGVELITGEAFETLVTSLEIDDQFISPYVQVAIGN